MLGKLMNLLKKYKIHLLVIIIASLITGYMMMSNKDNETFTLQLGKEMVFFSMNGCGHCDNMMPAWKQ